MRYMWKVKIVIWESFNGGKLIVLGFSFLLLIMRRGNFNLKKIFFGNVLMKSVKEGNTTFEMEEFN